MFNRILVAMNKPENTNHVFAQALALSKATQARLMLLHTVSPTEWQKHETESMETLRSLHHAVAATGSNADIAQLLGEPGQVICDLACRWGADLILMEQQDMKALQSPTARNVNSYVTATAPCAVLIIQRQPNEADTPESASQSTNAQTTFVPKSLLTMA
jgi:K+-sensing histidine kinase KdpD